MNRRDVLKLSVASLLPTWALKSAAPPVPLHLFCGSPHWQGGRYALASPFVQEARDSRLYSFATDAAVCVRIEARDSDKGDGLGQLPPCGDKLPWQHDRLTGWKPWPKERHLLAADARCPTCDGWGTNDKKPATECYRCEGYGLKSCEGCKGTGIEPPAKGWCRDCAGGGVRNAPDIQPCGEFFVEARMDKLIRRHLRDVEWTLVGPSLANIAAAPHLIAFRFDGGLGLVMPLDVRRVKERLTEAAHAR